MARLFLPIRAPRTQAATCLLGCLVPALGGRRTTDPVSPVEGTIAVDGAPIPSGTISFTPLTSNTGQPMSIEIHDGKYHSKKVPRGRSLVHITAFQDKGEKHVEFGITYPKLT